MTEHPTTFDDVEETEENYYERQVLKLTTLASLSSIVANILMSYTIIKYKNIRRDVTYIILLHLVVVQIFSLFLDEILLWFFTYFGTPLPQYHMEFCVIFVGVRLLNAMSFLMIILLAFNWFIKVYCSEFTFIQFTRFYRIALLAIYFFSACVSPFLTKLCLNMDVFATFYIVLSFQIITILVAINMTLLSKFKSRRNTEFSAGLGIANIILVFCTPAYFFLVLVYYNIVPVYVVLFADILATGVFPFVLLYIYKYDRNFQMYFKRNFVCRSKTQSDSVSYNLITDGAD